MTAAAHRPTKEAPRHRATTALQEHQATTEAAARLQPGRTVVAAVAESAEAAATAEEE